MEEKLDIAYYNNNNELLHQKSKILKYLLAYKKVCYLVDKILIFYSFIFHANCILSSGLLIKKM